MKRILSLLTVLLVCTTLVVGQTTLNYGFRAPFSALPKVAPGAMNLLKAVPSASPLVMNAWRPTATIAAYTYPGNMLMTGVGYGFQHLKYNDTTSKWIIQYSIQGMVFAGGQVTPSIAPYNIISYGVMVGILNNAIMVGPVLNGNKVLIAAAVAIPFNN